MMSSALAISLVFVGHTNTIQIAIEAGLHHCTPGLFDPDKFEKKPMKQFCLAALSTALLSACASAPEVLPFDVASIPASAETDPIISENDDRADDPAVWVNPTDPAKSLILGTDKEAGLYVYDLTGKTRQFLDVGRINNVDIRGNIAVASNDETQALSWFEITGGSDESVRHLGDTAVDKVEPYGVCLGRDEDGLIASPTYKDGSIEFWRAVRGSSGGISASLNRTTKLPSQLEGCVYDERQGLVFIGEEAFGIWALSYKDDAAEPVVVDRIADSNGLVEDTEGLSIWRGPDGGGYLVASAQAADRYVVYDVKAPFAPRGIFEVAASTDGAVDAVTHTDGLDVVSADLPGYSSGLLVVQDDGNPKSGQNQNFKLVDWAEVARLLGL